LVRVLGAISLAGVVDLRRGAQLNLGAGAVVQFLGATPEEQPERYLAASPFELLPIGVAQVLVHGLDDTVVPPFLSEDYARAARELGDEAVYVPIAGLGHREVIDPSSKSWPLIAEHLRRLLEV
jgi:pimeloyl-ACP methyl ester carboxylesterase